MSTGFSIFLTEDYTKRLSEESFLKALKDNCRNAHRAISKVGLFTGFKSDADFLLIDPKDRQKRDKFIIDQVTEELPSWERTPNRRKSLIGHTSLSMAREYIVGEESPYVMLPFDRGSLCMLHAQSFYIGLDKALRAMALKSLSNGQLRAWLASLRRVALKLKLAGITKEEPHSGKDFVKAVQELEELKNADKVAELETLDPEDRDRAEAFASRSGTALDFLNHVLDPDVNGVERVPAFHLDMPPDREVWTMTQCLLVSLEAYKKLYDDGKLK